MMGLWLEKNQPRFVSEVGIVCITSRGIDNFDLMNITITEHLTTLH